MGTVRQSAIHVVRTLQQHGCEAYFAGGCVRDMLLNKRPKDFDIATSALPSVVQQLFPRTKPVGKAFGVIQVHIDNYAFDVATFRSDAPYHDGRRPSNVSFTSARMDAQRRDFTINAIFFDPVARCFIDFCGGTEDISQGVIRCVGSAAQRFSEDHLRILRAIRFACSLDFEIESATAEAIRHHAPRLSRISRERVRDELLRTLTESLYPGDALIALISLGVLKQIMPETSKSLTQSGLKKPGALLNKLQGASEEVMITGLTLLVEKPETLRSELTNLRLPKAFQREVMNTHSLYGRLTSKDAPDSDLMVDIAEESARTALTLHRLTGDAPSHRRISRLAAKARRNLAGRRITGTDLKNEGIAEGPRMKQLLRRALCMQAEGKTRKQILQAILS